VPPLTTWPPLTTMPSRFALPQWYSSGTAAVQQRYSSGTAVVQQRYSSGTAAVQQLAYFNGCANNPVDNLSYLEIRNYGSSSQVGPCCCQHTCRTPFSLRAAELAALGRMQALVYVALLLCRLCRWTTST
jgi:hypothetical protein